MTNVDILMEKKKLGVNKTTAPYFGNVFFNNHITQKVVSQGALVGGDCDSDSQLEVCFCPGQQCRGEQLYLMLK